MCAFICLCLQIPAASASIWIQKHMALTTNSPLLFCLTSHKLVLYIEPLLLDIVKQQIERGNKNGCMCKRRDRFNSKIIIKFFFIALHLGVIHNSSFYSLLSVVDMISYASYFLTLYVEKSA